MRANQKNASNGPRVEGVLLHASLVRRYMACSCLERFLELVQLVLDLPQLLIRQGLFLLAVLQLLLQVLDCFLLVLVAQGGVLLHLDLVARTIVDLIRACVAFVLALAGVHGLTLNAQSATLHDPLLRGDAIAEFLVVRDDQDTALVVLDGQDQGPEPLAIEIVGGLIQDQDVRVLPHGGRQDHLHLHAAAQLIDLRVARRLWVHSKVAKVLLHARLGQLLRHEAGHGCLALVLTLHKLQVAHLDQDVLLHPGVGLDGLELPLDLVLVGLLLLLLAAVQDRIRDHGGSLILLRLLGVLLRVDAAAHASCDAVDAPLLGPSLLLIDRQLLGLELDALLVVIARETPHDVRCGCLLHVLLQVVEGMLCHIGHAKACGLPDGALGRLLLADQDLDGRGLACAVSADDRHSADLGHRKVYVEDRGLVLCRILEGHVGHAQDNFTAALHALHGAGLRERELHDLVRKLEVSLLVGILLDEHRQALALLALESLQLAVLEVDDVRAHLIQEGREVRRADNAASERLQPILEPLDVVHVQVSSRLVQHEHIRVHQLRSTELHLHLPTSRIACHRQLQVCGAVRAPWVTEANGLHELLHLFLRHLVIHLVDIITRVHDPPPAGLVNTEDGETIILYAHLLVLDLVLDEDTLELVTLGETLQLLVGDGAHQGRLTTLVRAQQTIEAIPLQVHLRVPQQGERAVGQ
mmetsp:Transcript_108344/g.271561  ORF Transcript_108344/g.271561 Transcript_108344/m.271561 type:complete len:696 (+) Transcript_108344:201-2288(+)